MSIRELYPAKQQQSSSKLLSPRTLRKTLRSQRLNTATRKLKHKPYSKPYTESYLLIYSPAQLSAQYILLNLHHHAETYRGKNLQNDCSYSDSTNNRRGVQKYNYY
ncbi:MAG: hypothetical protein RL660_1647 [Bacteroidota bacterium]